MPGHGGGGGGFGGGHSSGSHASGRGSSQSGMYHGYPMYHVWGYHGIRRRRALVQLFLGPVIMAVIAVAIALFLIPSMLRPVSTEGSVTFDESTIEDFADDHYYAAFGDLKDTEDEILLVYLINEARDGYYCVTWVGDHINAEIDNAFGDGTGSRYWRAVTDNVSDEFGDCLETDIAAVVEEMTDIVKEMDVSSSFDRKKCEGYPAFVPVVENNTDIPTDKKLSAALRKFTAETSIPIAVVIDEQLPLLQKDRRSALIVSIVFPGVLLTIAAVSVVNIMKSKRKFDGLDETTKEKISREDDFNRSDNYY